MFRTFIPIGKQASKRFDLRQVTVQRVIQLGANQSSSRIGMNCVVHSLQSRCFSTSNTKKVDLMNATKDKADEEESQSSNTAIRPKMRVSDILGTMEPKNFTIPHTSTVLDALSHLIDEKLASALVVNEKNEILGIFTARDILKCIQQHNTSTEYRQRRSNFLTEIKIKELMTSKNHLVYCSPSDSGRRCREIMFQCKIRNLPVIDNGEVRGIITAKHLADASFNVKDAGGKKGFIHNVSGRRGLPEGTRINQETILMKNHRSHQAEAAGHLDMEIACFALPHPFKRAEGVAMSRRLYGADELSMDLEQCEDAHFAMKVVDPLTLPSNAVIATPGEEVQEGAVVHGEDRPVVGWGAPAVLEVNTTEVVSPSLSTSRSHIYLCVADGVGSWRQFGVDPRQYSHRYVMSFLHLFRCVCILALFLAALQLNLVHFFNHLVPLHIMFIPQTGGERAQGD